MCLVFEYNIGFLATLMAPVLLQSKGTHLKTQPKSLKVATIQSK
jgi:hypothetical protein